MTFVSWFWEILRGSKPAISTINALVPVSLLASYPGSEMAVGQRLERAAALAVRTGEAVVVDQHVETISASVPNMPDERTLMEELTVLVEEAIAQPRFD